MAKAYKVTGLMSGSSLDGVDLACCTFIRNRGEWSFDIIASETLPYPGELITRLHNASNRSMEDIRILDDELGQYYGELINQFHSRNNLLPDLIASHGHTILHEPGKGITVQAGNGRIMANVTGVSVVSDFRKEDVAQGGEGAPLVPVGDRLLFGEYDACLNLGGFANVSYEGEDRQRIAFDVGPANMALNWIAGLMHQDFDRDGAISRSGKVDRVLLKELNELDFYGLEPPKSLGREWFLVSFLPILKRAKLDPADLMATVSEHIAVQISGCLNKLSSGSVLVTGGGAMNLALVEKIEHLLDLQMVIPDQQIIEYKEALIFALLGLLRVLGEINTLSSVTGGKSDLSAGTVSMVNR